MKQLVGDLTVRLDNTMPPLDTTWVVTADGRLWHHGAYAGRLRSYMIATRGVELDYEPRPVATRFPGAPEAPAPHPLCRCPDGEDYSPDCPIHPMPQVRAA